MAACVALSEEENKLGGGKVPRSTALRDPLVLCVFLASSLLCEQERGGALLFFLPYTRNLRSHRRSFRVWRCEREDMKVSNSVCCCVRVLREKPSGGGCKVGGEEEGRGKVHSQLIFSIPLFSVRVSVLLEPLGEEKRTRGKSGGGTTAPRNKRAAQSV